MARRFGLFFLGLTFLSFHSTVRAVALPHPLLLKPYLFGPTDCLVLNLPRGSYSGQWRNAGSQTVSSVDFSPDAVPLVCFATPGGGTLDLKVKENSSLLLEGFISTGDEGSGQASQRDDFVTPDFSSNYTVLAGGPAERPLEVSGGLVETLVFFESDRPASWRQTPVWWSEAPDSDPRQPRDPDETPPAPAFRLQIVPVVEPSLDAPEMTLGECSGGGEFTVECGSGTGVSTFLCGPASGCRLTGAGRDSRGVSASVAADGSRVSCARSSFFANLGGVSAERDSPSGCDRAPWPRETTLGLTAGLAVFALLFLLTGAGLLVVLYAADGQGAQDGLELWPPRTMPPEFDNRAFGTGDE